MGSDQMRVGNVTIIGLSDGTTRSPARESYPDVPDDAWGDAPISADSGPILVANIGSFLVRSGGRTILVDTGMGPLPSSDSDSNWGKLIDDMRSKSVEVDDVDTVFMTHLHFDHTGWNLKEEKGKQAPTFPKARYLASSKDLEFFRNEPDAARKYYYRARTVEPLESLGLIDLIDGDYPLTDELTTLHTPGHTPGHMSILVSSQGEKGIILGDVAHHPLQVEETGWKMMADVDHEQARKTRESIMERIEAEGLKMAAGHYPSPGFGVIVRLEGKRYWQAL